MSDLSFDLTPLFALQAALDEDIHRPHGVDYPSTHHRRVLALLVELGELANETRCFKYWSNKGPSPKEVVLDEYSDALHFFLSLGIPLGVESYTHHFRADQDDLTLQILQTYSLSLELAEHYEAKNYARAFGSFLNILPLLGYSPEEAVEAYKKKLAVNYKRQETGY